MARERFALGPDSLVVELASNDGYLLKNFLDMGIPVLGIDPSDTVARAAENIGVPTLVEFFGAPLAVRLASEGRRADLIIGNNVLAHVPRLNDFVAGIATLLKPTGTVTIEFPHLLKLIEHVEFDTIYHEHFSYLSLYSIERVFARHGLRIYEAEELPTHGGSLRIFAAHAARAGLEDGARLKGLRAREAAAGLADLAAYERFAERVEVCRRSVLEFLARARREGRTVAAYGAAAKGNTLLNFCNVSAGDIPMVADRNPHKQSKFLPGTHIPVVAPEELMRARPDYVLILPWNLQGEIRRQLGGHRRLGRPLRRSGSRRHDRSMMFTETALAGAYLVEMERIEDDRGFFARSFCAKEFAAHGLAAEHAPVQRVVQLAPRDAQGPALIRPILTPRTSSFDVRRARFST